MKNKFFEIRDKDKRIMELWYNNNTYDQIAQEVHASPNYISAVTKKEIIRFEKENREKENARALMLFSQGKSPLDVSMKLAIGADEALRIHNDYLKLTNRYKLVGMYEKLGEEVASLIDLYETMSNAGIPKHIIELSKDYYTIPYARNDLRMLLNEVKRLENKREQYISDWEVLNNHNMDLKHQNRYQKHQNRELEDRNRELRSRNSDSRAENLKPEGVKTSGKESLDKAIKHPKSLAPCLVGNANLKTSNKNFYMKVHPFYGEELQYLSFDPPPIPPMKLNKSPPMYEGNGPPVSCCHNMSADETRTHDPVRDLTSSKSSPTTTFSSNTHDTPKKELQDNADT